MPRTQDRIDEGRGLESGVVLDRADLLKGLGAAGLLAAGAVLLLRSGRRPGGAP